MQVLNVPIPQGEPWGRVSAQPKTLKQRLGHTREKLGGLATLFQHLHIMGRHGKYNATTKTVDVSTETCLLQYTRGGKGRTNTTSTADLIVNTAKEYLSQLETLAALMSDSATDPATLNEFEATRFNWTSTLLSAFEEFVAGDYYDQAMTLRFKTKRLCPTDVSTPYLMFEILMVHVVVSIATIERSRGRSFMQLTPDNQASCVNDITEAGVAISTGLDFLNEWFDVGFSSSLSLVRVQGKDHVLYEEYWVFLDAVRRDIFHVYELRVISHPDWSPPIQPSSSLSPACVRCGLMTRAQMGRYEAARSSRDALYACRYGVRSSSVERQISGTGQKMIVKSYGYVAFLRIACSSTVYMYLSGIIARLYGHTRGAPLEEHTYAQTRAKLAALSEVIGAYIGDKSLLREFNKSYLALQKDQPDTLFGWICNKSISLGTLVMSGLGSGKSYEGGADMAKAYTAVFRMVERDTHTHVLRSLVASLPILSQRWYSPLKASAISDAGASSSIAAIRQQASRTQEALSFIESMPEAPREDFVVKGKSEEEDEYTYEYDETPATRAAEAVVAS